MSDIAKIYQKKNLHEHILARPDSYIGSTKLVVEEMFVVEENNNEIIKKKIQYNPGLLKIFDEILVNAIDQSVREPETKVIKVSIKNNTEISVRNDGPGIPVVLHPEYKIYVPELIFGNLLTSSNYNDSQQRIVGGTNGFGSKCIGLLTEVPLFNGETKFAKDVEIGDELIGDDGEKRTVLKKNTGTGKMFEVAQCYGYSYTVNEDHILTLRMPSHKVISWNTDGWFMSWWENGLIKSKKMSSFQAMKVACDKCGDEMIEHSMIRHYQRRHPGEAFQSRKIKSPSIIPDMKHPMVLKTLEEMKNFAKTISDVNVFDIELKDYLKLSKTTQSRLTGVRGQCVNWKPQEILLDPYVLGLWLGDGTKFGGQYSCDDISVDYQLIDYLKKWEENKDALMTRNPCYTSPIADPGKKGSQPLRKLFQQYNLIDNKHIPAEYIKNSREVRLSVLAGMIDSAGHVERDGTNIVLSQTCKHEKLLYDILYLARSLGFYCFIRLYDAAYTYKGVKKQSKECIVNISGNIEDIPTLLPQKRCSGTKSRDTGKIKITPVGDGEYVGLGIDKNQRFLINDFTVTHNCTNIYSKAFTLETVDSVRKLKYVQHFKNNMFDKGEPKVTSTNEKSYTKITFTPDYPRFGLSELTPDFISLMKKRTFDTTGNAKVKVFFNGSLVGVKDFQSYIRLYKDVKDPLIYDKETQGKFEWEYAVSLADSYTHASFVNGISTSLGGRHLDYITGQIVKKLTDIIESKKKITVKPSYIKERLFFFVRATVVNPSFSNQSKDTLTTPTKDFGIKFEVSDSFIAKLYKSGIVEDIVSFANYKNQKVLEKNTDGKKKNKISIPKLEDANFAGTSKSEACRLILTEGDSAKTFAISGLSVIGRDNYGIFPMRGAVLNVREATVKQIATNEEIGNIKKILGLQQNKKYTNTSSLRYGGIIILTDADSDGVHIQGLVMNFIHTWWPELLEMKGFITKMKTPIVKASKGNDSKEFYTIKDYKDWEKSIVCKHWNVKYFKGLGTNTAVEAKSLFSRIRANTVNYTSKSEQETRDTMLLAFEKKQADARKAWLGTYNKDTTLDQSDSDVTYNDFVNKDLIHFSMYDNIRSIPSICDGLKPSQRKILYTLFSKNYKNEIKVAQLGAAVAEFSNYHHGEASLVGAIVNMAQDYIGSNNWNLLKPNGQFGTRILGGNDAASPRYIFTELSSIASKLFLKEDRDILPERFEEGSKIEPDFYVPIIPLILVNGSIGIGTGYSTSVPSFNPEDIISNMIRVAKKLPQVEMVPWYSGFKGKITKTEPGSFNVSGIYTRSGTNAISITELPVGTWTSDYKEYLEKLESDPSLGIVNVINNSSEVLVDFKIVFSSEEFRRKFFEGDAEKVLKMNKNISTKNMHLFDENGSIKKYGSVEDIVSEFTAIRLRYNQKRKDSLLAGYSLAVDVLDNKIRFLTEIIEGKFLVYRRTKKDIIAELVAKKYSSHDGYDYLIGMPIYSFTMEKIQELEEKTKNLKNQIADLEAKTILRLLSDDLKSLKN